MICPICGKVNLEAARSVSLSSQVTPSRTRRVDSRPPESHNSWEKGIAKDSRGMPYLDSNLQPVGVKEFAEKRNTGAWDHPGRKVST